MQFTSDLVTVIYFTLPLGESSLSEERALRFACNLHCVLPHPAATASDLPAARGGERCVDTNAWEEGEFIDCTPASQAGGLRISMLAYQLREHVAFFAVIRLV